MEYILSTSNKNPIITDQTCPLPKNPKSITAEALSIEDIILFNSNL